MESIGIPSTRTHAYWTSLPSPPLWTLGIRAAVGRVEHLEPLDLVTVTLVRATVMSPAYQGFGERVSARSATRTSSVD